MNARIPPKIPLKKKKHKKKKHKLAKTVEREVICYITKQNGDREDINLRKSTPRREMGGGGGGGGGGSRRPTQGRHFIGRVSHMTLGVL